MGSLGHFSRSNGCIRLSDICTKVEFYSYCVPLRDLLEFVLLYNRNALVSIWRKEKAICKDNPFLDFTTDVTFEF